MTPETKTDLIEIGKGMAVVIVCGVVILALMAVTP
jgi:hypothetical protein